jgi:hypothetical protein
MIINTFNNLQQYAYCHSGNVEFSILLSILLISLPPQHCANKLELSFPLLSEHCHKVSAPYDHVYVKSNLMILIVMITLHGENAAGFGPIIPFFSTRHAFAIMNHPSKDAGQESELGNRKAEEAVSYSHICEDERSSEEGDDFDE